MLAGSLFSGVGGLDLGLHRAGIRHAFFCEIDPWRRDVLAAHWPGVPVHHDVRDVGVRGCEPERMGGALRPGSHAASGDTKDCDLLCGGFPCQDLSVAGQRRGLAGARSGLFHEYARIAQSLRPRWLLIENVPGLLSSNGGRDFGTVLGTLADIGYGMAWRTLDSRFFGVPQRRRRVYIIGTVADGNSRAAAERAGQVLAVGTRCQRHPATRTQAGPDVAGNAGGGAGERGWAQDTERMTFVPDTSFALTTSQHRLGDTTQETFVASPLEASDGHHGYSSPRGDGADNLIAGAGVRRLTPVECERLQAWPDGWTNPDGKAPDSRRYAACGDGVTATVSEWIGRRLMTIHSAVPTSPRSDDNNRTEKVTSA